MLACTIFLLIALRGPLQGGLFVHLCCKYSSIRWNCVAMLLPHCALCSARQSQPIPSPPTQNLQIKGWERCTRGGPPLTGSSYLPPPNSPTHALKFNQIKDWEKVHPCWAAIDRVI